MVKPWRLGTQTHLHRLFLIGWTLVLGGCLPISAGKRHDIGNFGAWILIIQLCLTVDTT